MSDAWFAVCDGGTGECVSIGSVVANPLPAGLLAVPLSDIDAAAINAGRAYWDAASRSVVMRPPGEWPTVPLEP